MKYFLSTNLLSSSYRKEIKEILGDTKQFMYSINPNKNEFEQTLKSSLSSFEQFQCVRIGIDKKDNIYAFPGCIIHLEFASSLGVDFIYTFRYESNNNKEYLTDASDEFEDLGKEKEKELVHIIVNTLYYLPNNCIYSIPRNKKLVKFSDYITPQNNDKVELVNEPEYSRTIRKYHSESKRFKNFYMIDGRIK